MPMAKITIPPILQPQIDKWRKAMQTLQDQPFERMADQAALLASEQKHLSPFNAKLGAAHYKNDIPLYTKNASFILDYIAFYSVDVIVNLLGKYEYSAWGITRAAAAIPLHCKNYINPAAYYLDSETCVPFITSEKIYQKMLWLEWILSKMKDYVEQNQKLHRVVIMAITFFINQRLPHATQRLNDYAKEHHIKRLSLDQLEQAFDEAQLKHQEIHDPIQVLMEEKHEIIVPLQNVEPPLQEMLPAQNAAEPFEEKHHSPVIPPLSLAAITNDATTESERSSERSSISFFPSLDNPLLLHEKDSMEEQLKAYSQYLYTHFLQKGKEYKNPLVNPLTQYPASVKYQATLHLLQSLKDNMPPTLSSNQIAACKSGTLRKIIATFENKLLFLPTVITDINDTVRDKEKLVNELQNYIAKRQAEKMSSQNSHFYFWNPLFDCGYPAETKISASLKLLRLLKGKTHDDNANPITFAEEEIGALNSHGLGKIIAKYEKQVVMPEVFHEAKTRFKK